MKKARAKSTPRSPVAADVELGQRIRKRRLELDMSQPQLAAVIGVTFQQLQKYEKGVNRVKADRMSTIAQALKVRPESLYRTGNQLPDVASLIDVTDTNVVRMIRAWSKISDQTTQRELVALVETIAAAAHD